MLVCLILLFLGVGFGYFFYLYMEKNWDLEKCMVFVIVFYNNIQVNLMLDFMYLLKKCIGVVFISGIYYVDNKMSGVICCDVFYVWSENKDSIYFILMDINKVMCDEILFDVVIEMVLFDFYVYSGKSISYIILIQGYCGFMFIIGKCLIFFCIY